MVDLRKTLLNLSAGFSAVILVSAVVSGVGTRLGWWHFSTGLVVLRWSAYVAAGVPALVLIVLLWTLARRGRGGTRIRGVRYVVILVICASVIGVPYSAALELKKYPTVADATTNIEDPPVFKALVPIREKTAQNPLDYRKDEAARLPRKYFPELDSVRTVASPEEAIRAAGNAALGMGLDVVETDPAGGGWKPLTPRSGLVSKTM